MSVHVNGVLHPSRKTPPRRCKVTLCLGTWAAVKLPQPPGRARNWQDLISKLLCSRIQPWTAVQLSAPGPPPHTTICAMLGHMHTHLCLLQLLVQLLHACTQRRQLRLTSCHLLLQALNAGLSGGKLQACTHTQHANRVQTTTLAHGIISKVFVWLEIRRTKELGKPSPVKRLMLLQGARTHWHRFQGKDRT